VAPLSMPVHTRRLLKLGLLCLLLVDLSLLVLLEFTTVVLTLLSLLQAKSPPLPPRVIRSGAFLLVHHRYNTDFY